MDLFAADSSANSLSIRRSARAKRLQVRIFPHGHAEVVVPSRARAAEVAAFIAASQDWIEKTRIRAVGNGAAADLSLPVLIELPAPGEAWQVSYGQPGGRRRLREEAAPDGGRLIVAVPDPEARHLLRRWLSDRARYFLAGRVEAVAEETGLRPAGLSIRRQRTRWGSCTAGGRINLNCAALFLSAALIDYLIVHELCHLRHMNHSRRFWALVESFIPDFRHREDELADSWNRVPGWVFYGP